MTLCIAWKAGSTIHLAADSTLGFHYTTVDAGIKVVALPFRIFGAAHNGQEAPLLLSGEIGICYAGSVSNAFSFKETLAELLRHLQVATQKPTMTALADFIYIVYKEITDQYTLKLSANGLAAFIVSGYIDDVEGPKAYLISTNPHTGDHNKVEILQSAPYEVLGSGKQAATQLLNSLGTASSKQYLSVLQAVIDDPNVVDVGGHITYGHTSRCGFQTFGVQEFNASGMHHWRGSLDFNSQSFQMTGIHSGFNIAYPMIVKS